MKRTASISIIIILGITPIFAQNYERTFDNSASVLSEDNVDDLITQYNSITLILDTLAFKSDVANTDYYVNLRVRLFKS